MAMVLKLLYFSLQMRQPFFPDYQKSMAQPVQSNRTGPHCRPQQWNISSLATLSVDELSCLGLCHTFMLPSDSFTAEDIEQIVCLARSLPRIGNCPNAILLTLILFASTCLTRSGSEWQNILVPGCRFATTGTDQTCWAEWHVHYIQFVIQFVSLFWICSRKVTWSSQYTRSRIPIIHSVHLNNCPFICIESPSSALYSFLNIQTPFSAVVGQ